MSWNYPSPFFFNCLHIHFYKISLLFNLFFSLYFACTCPYIYIHTILWWRHVAYVAPLLLLSTKIVSLNAAHIEVYSIQQIKLWFFYSLSLFTNSSLTQCRTNVHYRMNMYSMCLTYYTDIDSSRLVCRYKVIVYAISVLSCVLCSLSIKFFLRMPGGKILLKY
jgi:hypothetical protein